jgi:hypothetical protein
VAAFIFDPGIKFLAFLIAELPLNFDLPQLASLHNKGASV